MEDTQGRLYRGALRHMEPLLVREVLPRNRANRIIYVTGSCFMEADSANLQVSWPARYPRVNSIVPVPRPEDKPWAESEGRKCCFPVWRQSSRMKPLTQ